MRLRRAGWRDGSVVNAPYALPQPVPFLLPEPTDQRLPGEPPGISHGSKPVPRIPFRAAGPDAGNVREAEVLQKGFLLAGRDHQHPGRLARVCRHLRDETVRAPADAEGKPGLFQRVLPNAAREALEIESH